MVIKFKSDLDEGNEQEEIKPFSCDNHEIIIIFKERNLEIMTYE